MTNLKNMGKPIKFWKESDRTFFIAVDNDGLFTGWKSILQQNVLLLPLYQQWYQHKTSQLSLLPYFYVVVAELIQVFGWTWPTIEILSVVGVPLKMSSNFQICLWMYLFPSFNSILNIIISIGTIASKLPLGKHIIARIRYRLLSSLALLLYVIWPIAWVSVENSSIHLQLSLRTIEYILLDGILDIITSIGSEILEFSLREYFISRHHGLLLPPN